MMSPEGKIAMQTPNQTVKVIETVALIADVSEVLEAADLAAAAAAVVAVVVAPVVDAAAVVVVVAVVGAQVLLPNPALLQTAIPHPASPQGSVDRYLAGAPPAAGAAQTAVSADVALAPFLAAHSPQAAASALAVVVVAAPNLPASEAPQAPTQAPSPPTLDPLLPFHAQAAESPPLTFAALVPESPAHAPAAVVVVGGLYCRQRYQQHYQQYRLLLLQAVQDPQH
jgi:hypothetical protein